MPPPTGLSPNIRLFDHRPKSMPLPDEDGMEIEVANDVIPDDQPKTDEKGNVIEIEHGDGSITISMDGRPLIEPEEENPPGWFDNLVFKIDQMQLGIIADDLIRGVEEDIQSRTDWIDQRVEGLKLLGLKPETPDTGDSADGAAVEGMSRIRHPMMLEACLRFAANAYGEMLPTDGPVKIKDDDNNQDAPRDRVADAYQQDFNHFLTVTAKEYYPDTDRMFFELGFSGLAYKKIFFCSLRNRPVSESVSADDIIINNNATTLDTAKRITHRIMMPPNEVRRMQIMGIYDDTELITPSEPNYDALQEEKKDQQGISIGTMRPEDRDRELYEVYCNRDIKGFEHKWKGRPSGFEVPYRITIDVSSRKILSIVRNYNQETEALPVMRNPFVMYTFAPGFGFYPIGLLHIMSNMTNASTAAWRIMLDNGMFANFPGFLIAKSLTRQNTNIVRVAPGSGAQIDTEGNKIQDAVMPLPYKTEGMAALMTLQKDITEQAQRVGMTSELPSGEGRDDVPVGTILATIEQAQKVLSAVHKRMHQAQSEEFQKLRDCFREHPESFWECNNKPAQQWDEQTFMRALEDCKLVPKADPNTANQMQRLMKIGVLQALQSKSPTLYDPIAVDTAALEGIGFTNPNRFFAPPSAQAKPPPEIQAKQEELRIKAMSAEAGMMKARAEAGKIQQEAGLGAARFQLEQMNSDVDNKVKVVDTQLKHAIAHKTLDDKTEQRLTDERVQLVDAAQNLIVHPESAHLVAPLLKPAFMNVERKQRELDVKRTGLNPVMP